MRLVKFYRLPVCILAIMTSLIMAAQERKLPAPSFSGGVPMNEVVAKRHSVREFDVSRDISDSTLSQLLWMAVGINRPDAASGRSRRPQQPYGTQLAGDPCICFR